MRNWPFCDRRGRSGAVAGRALRATGVTSRWILRRGGGANRYTSCTHPRPPTCFSPDVCGGEGGDPVGTAPGEIGRKHDVSDFTLLTDSPSSNACSAASIGPSSTDRAAGSDRPTAIQGAFNRAHGGAPAAQPATEPSVTRRGRSTAVGPRRFAAFAAATGPASRHRRPPPLARRERSS